LQKGVETDHTKLDEGNLAEGHLGEDDAHMHGHDDVTCAGLRLATEYGVASDAFAPEDFESYSGFELRMCLEALGLMKWPLEERRDMWQAMKKKEVHAAIMRPTSPRFISALGGVFEAAAEKDVDSVEFSKLQSGSRIDAASLVGQIHFEEVDVLARVADEAFKLIEGKVGEEGAKANLAAMVLPGFGDLLCGMSIKQVNEFLGNDDVAKVVLVVAGQSDSCGGEEQKELRRALALKVRPILAIPTHSSS